MTRTDSKSSERITFSRQQCSPGTWGNLIWRFKGQYIKYGFSSFNLETKSKPQTWVFQEVCMVCGLGMKVAQKAHVCRVLLSIYRHYWDGIRSWSDELILDGWKPRWMTWWLSGILGARGRLFQVFLWGVRLVPGSLFSLFLFSTFSSFSASFLFHRFYMVKNSPLWLHQAQGDGGWWPWIENSVIRPKFPPLSCLSLRILSQRWKADWQRWTISSFYLKVLEKHNNPFPFIS